MTESVDVAWSAHADLMHGIEVVEISSGVAAAYCGTVLAQLGAAVSRYGGDTLVTGSAATQRLMQHVLHRGKAALDAAGLDTALARAHLVVVDVFPEGDPKAERVRAIAAGRGGLADATVVVVLSAAGAEEDALSGGCGLTSSASAGLSFAIGSRSVEPLGLPYDIADYQAGINGVAAALAGLIGHMGIASGPIDVASRDVLANLVGTLAQNYVPYGRPWRREGTRPSMSGGVYPCGLFPCKDGYIALYCRGTREFKGLMQAMGNPPWSQEERFDDPKIVAALHADEADGHLLPWLGRFTRAELMALGLQFGFPAAPVRYVREALQDEQFAFRGSFQPLARDAGLAPVQVPAPPWRLRAPATKDCAPAPAWARTRTRTAETPPSQVLKGLRVLDFSWVWSGPMVTSFLADLGAEVIKVEHPSRLDSLRLRGRPLRDGVEVEGPSGEVNPWFNQLNHAKKSITADLKLPRDRDRLLRLAESCDVVVENMRPGALAACGLGYDDLVARSPGLVMLSMSMAGQTGPLAQMKGYAGLMTSMAGLESITGYASDAVDAPFVGMVMTALGDPNGAMHGIAVLLAALHRRTCTGQGIWIDLSQTDAILAVMAAPLLESQLHGHVPLRGNSHPNRFPHGHYRCAGDDRWLALSVAGDAKWRRLAEAVGPALAPFAGFDLARRQASRAQIEQAIGAWTGARSANHALTTLRSLGIDCAPVAAYEEMLQADWKSSRGLTRVVQHPYLGQQEVFVPAWRFGGRTAGVAAAAPLLGQHTADYLHDCLRRPIDSPREPTDSTPKETAMKPTVTASSAALGARIDHIDLSKPISDADFECIEDAFHEHSVVCISGRPYDDESLTRFGKRFGELEINVAKSFHHKLFPQVTVLSNLVVDGKPLGSPDAGQSWHTDMSYNRVAGRCTILHAHQVPMRGGVPLGDTAFRNMYKAYEALAQAMRNRLDTLEAVHEFEKNWNGMIAKGSKRPPFSDAQRAEKPPVVHPVVLVHPWTGRKALYVNRGLTQNIIGLPQDESDELLEFLFAHAEKPEFAYSHPWRVGDTLVWDNCASIHMATGGYDSSTPRLMHRVQVLGNEDLYRQKNRELGLRLHALGLRA